MTTHATDPDAFRVEARSWLAANATPRSEDEDFWAITIYASEEESQARFDAGRAWQRTLYDAGYGALGWPEELGGNGGHPWQAKLFREEAAAFKEDPGFIGATIAMLGPTLLQHGSEDQKTEYLPRLWSGDLTFCQLFSEPGAGSDLASLGARGVRDGDELIVTGQKVWNSAAQHCDWGFLLVRTDVDAPKHRGITFVLVDMATPGIEVRPLVQINRSAHFNEVFFEEVRIPVANVVGAIDEGWGPTRTVLSNESAFIGRGGSSSYARLVELARRYERLAEPTVRQDLARVHTSERLLSLTGQRIQASIQGGKPPPVHPGVLKLAAALGRVLSGNLAMSIMGGDALAGDTPEGRWARQELMLRYAVSIGGGTNEVQRNNVAERWLGLPREPGLAKETPWRDIPK